MIVADVYDKENLAWGFPNTEREKSEDLSRGSWIVGFYCGGGGGGGGGDDGIIDWVYRVKRNVLRGPAGSVSKMLTMALAVGRVGGEGVGLEDGPTPGNTIHKEGAGGL